jgi:uncharacterized protein (TIGR00299 family) protein
MIIAALVDLGVPPQVVADAAAALPVAGYHVHFGTRVRSGIVASHFDVHVDAAQPERTYKAVKGLLAEATLAPGVRARAEKTFALLAAAEAKVHRMPVDEVHFHEVGAIDAIVDVVGSCAALEALGIDEVRASPIAVGLGTFRAAHGVLPNPGPATLGLLARVGAPAHGVDLDLELTTPTGAALMTALAAGFGAMPAMSVDAVGYGAGKRDVDGRPNVVQVVIGTSAQAGATGTTPAQPVRLLEANVDDVTAEVLAHAVGALLAAGAYDAWITPIVMKKGRPAFTVSVLADPVLAPELAARLCAETGSLGVRGRTIERWPRAREEGVVDVDGVPVRIKIGAGRVKVEHDDAVAAARHLDLPLRQVMARAEAAADRTR